MDDTGLEMDEDSLFWEEVKVIVERLERRKEEEMDDLRAVDDWKRRVKVRRSVDSLGVFSEVIVHPLMERRHRKVCEGTVMGSCCRLVFCWLTEFVQ